MKFLPAYRPSRLMMTFLAVRDFLSTISGPIVLVGHFYGGTVITNAATGDKQVKALVYVDAFLPAQGETTEELNTAVLVPRLLR